MTREEEELEFIREHPGVNELIVPWFLPGWKHGMAGKEGARQAAKRGVVTRAVKLR
jgi:hypothetical protein